MTTSDAMKILVIEDDFDLRRILELQLRKLGFQSRTAENGKVGFEIAKEWEPDLILLDLMMPR